MRYKKRSFKRYKKSYRRKKKSYRKNKGYLVARGGIRL
jgi:hypothetical protein